MPVNIIVLNADGKRSNDWQACGFAGVLSKFVESRNVFSFV